MLLEKRWSRWFATMLLLINICIINIITFVVLLIIIIIIIYLMLLMQNELGEDVNRDGEDDGAVVLGRDVVQGLEVAQLERSL